MSERATQPEMAICEACRGPLRYKQTFSPWEFEGECEVCGSRHTRSWAHGEPAPMFVLDGTPVQGRLL